MVRYTVWQAYLFTTYAEFEGNKINLDGNAILSLVVLTVSLIAMAMWLPMWIVECLFDAPYWSERRKRERGY